MVYMEAKKYLKIRQKSRRPYFEKPFRPQLEHNRAVILMHQILKIRPSAQDIADFEESSLVAENLARSNS